MMDLNEFAEYVRDNIENYLMSYDIEKIDISRVEKTNGVMLTGLVVVPVEKRISPSIYLENFYAEYEMGVDMESIMRKISNKYMEAHELMLKNDFNRLADNMDASGLFLKAVNYSRNKERLQGVVYEHYMDLALEVRMLFGGNEDGVASASVTYELLERLDMSRKEAFEQAKKNTPHLFPVQFDTLSNILRNKDMIDEEIGDMEDMMPPVYLITNKQNVNGATYIFYENVITQIMQEKHISEDMYILPSSVHEILLIPVGEETDIRMLQMMVQDVNRCAVSQEEYLSDNVYRYDASEREILQVTDVEKEQIREDDRGR